MRSDRPGEHRLRDQIRFLLDTARALSREPDLDALFRRLHELIVEQFPTWSFVIALDAGNGSEMEVAFHAENGRRLSEPVRVAIDQSITGEVFRSGQPMVVRSREEFARLRTIVVGPSAGSAIYAPLRAGERTIGVISVQSDRPYCYNEEDLELLVAVGEQTAIAVLNAWRMLEIEQQRLELELLVELGQGLASDEFSLQQMCRRIHAQLATIIDAHVFYAALLSDDGERLHPAYCVEGGNEVNIEAVPLSRTLAESVLIAREPMVIGNLQSDGRVRKYDRIGNKATAMRSLIMLPLHIGERPIGILSVQSPRVGAYDGAALRLLRSIADQLALAVNNAQLYRQTEERADRDALTNLYNRRYGMRRLNDELERATRRGTRVCVLMLDLNNFKAINDTHGHPIGDVALVHIAEALRRSCRASDILCRYGGDEFFVIFPDLVEAEAAPMVTRLRDELLRRPLPVPGGAVAIEASIGVAVSEAGMDADALLLAADRALYRDKERVRRERE
jgi:diguanylate cyclase (GGDEF)-like protein